jgi:pyrimidine operon attenuation protein / uracil phosphoribosyltransferase
MKESVLLTNIQLNQKIDRLAYQLLENTFEEKQLFIAGITGNGITIAHDLATIIGKEYNNPIEVFELVLDKEAPLSQEITANFDFKKLENACVILVDDVINSGLTMQYALMKILEQKVHKVKTVALVDREHRRFPIKCDFVGLTLSTTLHERVELLNLNGEMEAFLI